MMRSVAEAARRRRKCSAVLMARLVDRDGKCLRPDLIRSIAYWLIQLDEEGERDRLMAGHSGRPLDVDKVVLPNLVNDRSWEVDCSGYNFQHRLVVAASKLPIGSGGMPFELLYHITDIFGEESVVSFRLRSFPL